MDTSESTDNDVPSQRTGGTAKLDKHTEFLDGQSEVGAKGVVNFASASTLPERLPAYEIALATCDGERFLEEQLKSLQAQTLTPRRLVVVDDASTDQSLTILRGWARESGIPVLAYSQDSRQGSLATFGQALAATEAGYVLLCDQDDHWDSDKAEILLHRMLHLEALHGVNTPLLVHSNLRVMDAAGNVNHPSFHRLQNLEPQRDTLLDLAFQNTVTGCATLVNRACLKAALPFPEHAVLHDWWLAMVAARLGFLDYDPTARLSYRQHGRNLVGAAGFGRHMRQRLRQLPEAWASGALVVPAIVQLQTFVHRYGPTELIPAVEQLVSGGRRSRLRAAMKLQLGKHGWLRSIGFYICLMLWQSNDP